MIVDESGDKMSKSKGNGISPQDIIDKYGADLLRLWVVSADYKTDMRISDGILKQLSEFYRKIRNTARYILGNIHDFNPNTDMVDVADMPEIDKWAMIRLSRLVEKVLAAYRNYEFHIVQHSIHNFCIVEMSNFYLDVIKDRLYTTKPESKERRAAQTVMYKVLDALVRMLAPVLAYTAEEIWSFMPHVDTDEKEFVLLNDMPKSMPELYDEAFEAKWAQLMQVKGDVSKALETARAAKVIGSSLGAAVSIFADGSVYDLLSDVKEELTTYFIVSDVKLAPLADATGECNDGETGIRVAVAPAGGEKCERCWMFSDTVGKDDKHPTLCARCASVLKED